MNEKECGRYEIWYRGYNSKYGFFHTGLLWLTNDISYARLYGNRVDEVTLDIRKIIPAPICNVEYDFDCLTGPSDEQVTKLLNEGYNGYYYYANNEISYCLCLWDLSIMIKRNTLSRKEYDKIVFYCSSYRVPHYDDDYESLTEFNNQLSKKYIQ